MRFEETKLRNLWIISPEPAYDKRGLFMEIYRSDLSKKHGLDISFVQANHSLSQKNVIRGLHFQWDRPLGKLMRVVGGSAFMVAADIRKNSPTLGKWFGEKFSAENKKILWAPPGFATGFAALSKKTEVEYFYTASYNPQGESSIIWNDKNLAISWPVKNPILSARDARAQSFKDWLEKPESNFFKM